MKLPEFVVVVEVLRRLVEDDRRKWGVEMVSKDLEEWRRRENQEDMAIMGNGVQESV